MIAYIKGEIFRKTEGAAIIIAGGVGYEVNLAQAALDGMREGAAAELYIRESLSPYDGTALYGFRTVAERELFDLFRDCVPGTGARKSLELLGKALKSLPDFRRAVISRDARLLTGIFGFTGKTAEKLIVSLKDKLGALPAEGATLSAETAGRGGNVFQVYEALSSLGYSASEVKKAVEALHSEGISPQEAVEDLLRRALKKVS
ncbi:MAG: Holliday junction branch migration protein RuvA [Elusimicrobiales bacterium]